MRPGGWQVESGCVGDAAQVFCWKMSWVGSSMFFWYVVGVGPHFSPLPFALGFLP